MCVGSPDITTTHCACLREEETTVLHSHHPQQHRFVAVVNLDGKADKPLSNFLDSPDRQDSGTVSRAFPPLVDDRRDIGFSLSRKPSP